MPNSVTATPRRHTVTMPVFMCYHHGMAMPKVCLVHFMNADSSVRWPPTVRPCQINLSCESTYRLLSSTPTVTVFCFYSPQEVLLVLVYHGGWGAESGDLITVCRPCPDYIAVAAIINTIVMGGIWLWVSHTTVRHAINRPLISFKEHLSVIKRISVVC